jgi:hypothetical protein
MTRNEPFDFGPMLDAAIARFTVSFVSVDAAELLGSATLVKCKRIGGFLTCGHVLRKRLEQHKEVGLVLFPAASKSIQRIKLDVSIMGPPAIVYFDNAEDWQGCDLAFLPLPPVLMADVEAKGSAVDLRLHAERAGHAQERGTVQTEVVAGGVAKMMGELKELEKRKIRPVGGLLNVARCVERKVYGGFDYLWFEAVPGEDFTLPDSYGGTSGGGIWQVYAEKQGDGSYKHVETRLHGVAFRQTDAPNRKIIGHGPESIFSKLLPEIEQRWS